MRSETFTVVTGARAGVFDVTRECERFVHQQRDGLLNVFVPHATAGIAVHASLINEELSALNPAR